MVSEQVKLKKVVKTKFLRKENLTIRKNIDLLTVKNHKTVKGEVMGIKTLILYLSPYKDNSKGKNLCPKASAGCSKACLFNSGHGGLDKVANARRNKTEWFLQDRAGFVTTLVKEIETAVSKYSKDWVLAIRLNGTSDIVWENILHEGKNIFETFPDIQFYDYTKISNRFKKPLAANYHLTFSRSEDNEVEALDLLKKGFNVAWVFNKVPLEYNGYKVINGDESDVRVNDEKGVIVGLRYKNATGRNGKTLNENAKTSGFVTIL